MGNWNLRDYCTDLSTFIKLIENNNVQGDFDELGTLLTNLENGEKIRYNFKNVCFYVNESMKGRSYPNAFSKHQIFFDNKFFQKSTIIKGNDPLYQFSLNINVHAFTSNKSTNFYRSCWHLDKEYRPEASDRYIHPTYHLQFGGNKMKGVKTGDVAILPAPRISHPPMDVFLGFHFILLNFFDKTVYPFVDELLDDVSYQEIIKRAQDRIWKPYFEAYDSKNTNTDFTVKNIFPYYLK